MIDLEWGFPSGSAVKNPPAIQETGGDMGLNLGSGRSPWRGHGNSLQYSCLENPIDRGALQTIVHRVAKSWTQLKQLSTHKHSRLDAVSRPLKYVKVFLRQTMQCLRSQGLLFSR